MKPLSVFDIKEGMMVTAGNLFSVPGTGYMMQFTGKGWRVLNCMDLEDVKLSRRARGVIHDMNFDLNFVHAAGRAIQKYVRENAN